MAYYNYYRPRNWGSLRKESSVKGVTNFPQKTKRGTEIKLNNYLTLPDTLQFIVRFTIHSTDIQGDIDKCNKHLRKLFNKKAPRKKIPLNGIRYISLIGDRNDCIIVYNFVLDHLYSAIWLMTELAPVEEVEEFCWIKYDVRVELRESLRQRCRPMLFNIVCDIFNDNKKVNMVEIANASVHIGFTGRESRDFNPQSQPTFFYNKPRYRAIQRFGTYSRNHKQKPEWFSYEWASNKI